MDCDRPCYSSGRRSDIRGDQFSKKQFSSDAKIMTRNAKIGWSLAGGALAVLGGIALYNHFTAVAIVRDLNEVIAKNENPEGTASDIKGDKGFDPNYWKSINGNKVKTIYLKVAEARAYAKAIYDDIGVLTDDEMDIVTLIQRLRNKVQLSQVSFYFADQYKQNLGDFIVSLVDKGTNLEDIQRAIMKMPLV